jgi:hypothetical protein
VRPLIALPHQDNEDTHHDRGVSVRRFAPCCLSTWALFGPAGRANTGVVIKSRRVVRLSGVMSLVAVLLLAGCSAAATRRALSTARVQLDRVHAENLGPVVGRGSYGSAGVSGDRPTAFLAVRTDSPTEPLMATIAERMQQAGFTPFVRCRPPNACLWDRRVDNKLFRAWAYVLTSGQPWGDKSTAHGTVAAGDRVLVVRITVGG